MNKTVVVVLETTRKEFAAGTAAQAGITFTLSNGAPAQTITAAPYSASFADVAPGNYTVVTQAIDVNGQPVDASATSTEFTVIDDSVGFDIPSTMTVTVS